MQLVLIIGCMAPSAGLILTIEDYVIVRGGTSMLPRGIKLITFIVPVTYGAASSVHIQSIRDEDL